MKFYSEVTNSMYDSMEAAEAAEVEFNTKKEKEKAEKETALADLENAKTMCDMCAKRADEANKEYHNAYKLLADSVTGFYKKYGYVPKEYQKISFSSSVLF